MNKKTILALAAFVAAGSALATVESGNTLCRIALTVTTQQVMIGLPLVDVGGTTTISPDKFVLTDGLEDGTTIEYKDSSGKWKGWYKTTENNVGKWEQVKTNGAPAEHLDRGGALILTRPDLDELGLNSYSELTIYLYGQVASGKVGSLLQGYNLLGNPGTTEITSLDGFNITPVEGDQLIIPTVWKGTQVMTMRTWVVSKNDWDRAFSIPAGQGFWYYRK